MEFPNSPIQEMVNDCGKAIVGGVRGVGRME